MIGTSSPERGQFSLWSNMKDITGKAILMAYTAGEAARTIEGWDDEKTKREALARLRDTFPGTVPDPWSRRGVVWGAERGGRRARRAARGAPGW